MNLLKAAHRNTLSWARETFQKTGVRQWLLATLVFVILGSMLLSNAVTERFDLSAGQVAPRDIEAPQRVVNRYRTELERSAHADRAVAEAVERDENYVVNQAVAVRAKESVAAFFGELIRALPTDGTGGAEAGREPAMRSEAVALRVLEITSLEFPDAVISQGLNLSQAELERLRDVASVAAARILETERITESNLPEVRAGLDERIAAVVGDDPALRLEPSERSFVAGAIRPTIGPNLVLDLQRVNQAKDAAARNVRPVYVERGQIIVRKGDIVTDEHIMILQDLGMLRERPNYGSALGHLMILVILMSLFGVYLYQHHEALVKDERHLALLALVLVMVAGIAKVLGFFIPSEGAAYLVPVALATMLIAILLDAHVAVVSAVFLALFTGMVTGHEMKVVAVALVNGFAGVFSVSRVGERSHLTRAGLLVGGVTFVAMAAFGLVRADRFLLTYSFLGVANGLISAIGTIGLFPYLESVFGITSNIRLLELSNPNQPLLRKLLMEAPGSYHHSMIVGNLAEAAAEAVGGDVLLTRVGAQYHDIGKTKRPYFFIENQYGGENPHDKISPTLSTLILTSHVKDGVELAQKHRIPDCVIDFIRQHHGTTLVKYFYHKAVENAKDEVHDEADFRYPGPRPQSKETAIVLLADSVEAAVRTLSRPTPGRIEGLVRKIIKDHLADGQLDESDLTLKDLDKVADAFVRVLTGIFHKRVEYPETIIKEMEAKRA